MSRISFQLKIDDIAGRLLGVRLRVENAGGKSLRVKLPSWVPGSYLQREYAGQIRRLAAQGGGRELQATKIDRHGWEIEACDGPVEINYQLYAPERSVRTSDLSDEGAFLHPAATWLCVEGHEAESISVEIDSPKGWNVATALPGKFGQRSAENYDQLVDCPIALGPGECLAFDLLGTRHEFFRMGDAPGFDEGRALEDIRKICAEEAKLFGGLPMERYVFLLMTTPKSGGGLEYSTSTALAWPRHRFWPEKEYHRFLTLVAHEYFHLWNVKRIRPRALEKYNYFHEQHTRLLWVFEGITSYFDELTPVRAGCYGATRMLEFLAERIQGEASRPGRHLQSLAESSFDTWIKLYRPTPDTPNSQVSYYEKGMLVAMLLDLMLRRTTSDQRSLDDFLRTLWAEAQAGRTIPEDGIPALLEAATGIDARSFLRQHIEGVGALQWDEALSHVGLRLRPKKLEEGDRGGWLGAVLETREGECHLATVYENGPANEAGLMSGDVLIALDGLRMRRDFPEHVRRFAPGERIRLGYFRSDRLLETTVVLGENPSPSLELVRREEISDAQKASFQAWCGQSWKDAFADAKD